MIGAVWMPSYRYKMKDRHGKTLERAFLVREFQLRECPVSIIQRSPKSAQLVKIWHSQCERRDAPLREALGMDEAWIDDAENLFHETKQQIQNAYETDVRMRRI